MMKKYLLSPLIVFILLLVGYELYVSHQGRELMTAAYIAEGLSLATPVKVQVAEHYAMYGEFPNGNAELGLPRSDLLFGRSVKSVEVLDGGRIQVAYKSNFGDKAAIMLTPSVPEGYAVRGLDWQCTTDSIPQEYFQNISFPCLYAPPSALGDLMAAIASGDDSAVAQAMEKGADVNGVLYGSTPLFSSINGGWYVIAERLLKAGANANQVFPNRDAVTPLIKAASQGKDDFILLLLSQGGNIDAADAKGKTALMHAIEKKHESSVKVLLDNGANPLWKDNRGKDAGDYAARYTRNGSVEALIDTAKSSFVSRQVMANAGITALMRAAAGGKVEQVRSLLAEGAAIDETDSSGATAIHYAIATKQSQVVDVLMDAGANLELADRDGDTPLILAVKKELADVVYQLVMRGVTIQVHDRYDNSPLIYAIRAGNSEITNFLLNNGVVEFADKLFFELFSSAISEQSRTEIQDLLIKFPLTFSDDAGNLSKLFSIALAENNMAVIELLLRRGVNPNERLLSGDIALHVAIRDGNYALTRLLLESGANINLLDTKGRTPLMVAVGNRKDRIVRYLLDHGADTTIRDNNGWTALRMARENAYEEIADLLRQY